MMKEQMAHSTATEEQVWITVYQEGRPVDRLVAHPDSKPIRIAEGMQLTDSFGIHPALTERHYRTPLSIEATVMTDSTNIVLVYGKGQVILNWDRREDLLHIRHPVTGQAFNMPGLGSVPAGRWHQVEWVIAEDVMRFLVNGEERFALPGNYRGLQGPIGIRTGWRANLRVGMLAVKEHRPADFVSAADNGAAKSRTFALPGYRPAPHEHSLWACLLGAMHYYNRYIDESDWMGVSGLAFSPPRSVFDKDDENLRLLQAQARLLGIDIQPAETDHAADLLAEGVPLFAGFKGKRPYMAVTGCEGRSLIFECPERGGLAFYPDEQLQEGEAPRIYSVRQVEGTDRRHQMEAAFRLAAKAGEDNAHAYRKWLEAISDTADDPSRHAGIASEWRKAREQAVLYLHRSMEQAGPSLTELIKEGSRLYQTIAAALGEAERWFLDGASQRPSDSDWQTKAADSIRRAASLESSVSEIMRRLSEELGHQTMLEGLRYHGMSCMSPFNTYRGIVNYYGIACSDAWLQGITGRPLLFAMHERINVHDFCIPLPERRLVELFGNIGLDIGGVEGCARGEAYRSLLREAWDAARKAIDEGWACFGRAVDFPGGEYSIIRGYDRDGYYTSSWHGPSERTIPWTMYGLGQCPCEPCTARRVNFQDEGPVRTVCRCDECQRNQQRGAILSPQEEGEVRLYWTKPKPAPGDRTAVREALQLAVEFADPAGKWAQPGMVTGPDAFDVLIRALEKGQYDGWYLGLHANAWRELRHSGWRFLIEVKERLNDPALDAAFDAAIGYAAKLNEAFGQLNEMFPWMQPFGPIPDVERRYAAADLMRGAKQAEIGAVQAYRRLVELL
ncbi:hypothetical protein [Paenibacillus residui]|uniref:Uncharacterized protein n=1 Tax=Paenibacillus residui TaxID=629724 RepID=A0ABW3DFH3_9BACL